MTVTAAWYLILAAVLFTIGGVGLLLRRTIALERSFATAD